MKQGEDEIGYYIYNHHRFFIVDDFHLTNFIKDSPYDLRGSKYFDIIECLGDGMNKNIINLSNSDIAKLLNDKKSK